MDQLDTKDSAAQATALLGLRVGKSGDTAVGSAPTTEEFGALYDGTLDATRRAQVLSHVAADPDVYRAFLEVASAQASLDESLAGQPRTAQDSPPMLRRLGNWLASMVRTPVLAGGMVAAALVAVLVIPGQDNTRRWAEIDQIYSEFGHDWQASPSTLLDTRIRGTGNGASASPEHQAVYLGLRFGLELLGDEFPTRWLPEIVVDERVDTLPADVRAALEATGKLATLARFQCQLEGKTAFFIAAEKSLDNLRPSLDINPSRSSVYLAKVIDQPGSAHDRVCDFSSAAVAMLSNK